MSKVKSLVGAGKPLSRKRYTIDHGSELRFKARSLTAQICRDVPGQWGPSVVAMASYDLNEPVWMRAGLWVDRLVAFKKQHGDALRWSMSDGEICAKAKEIAAQVNEYLTLWPVALSEPEKLDIVRMVCQSLDVPVPVAMTAAGAIARGVSDVWWRRVLRKKMARVVEHGAIKLGVVNASAGAYCSDNAVVCRTEQKKRNADMLKKRIMRNEAGQCFTLADLAAKSPANPEIRGGELMTRIRGCEEFAESAGHVGVFGTMTAPSCFHPVKVGGKTSAHKPRPNRLYDGVSTPRDVQAWHCKIWARCRAELARRGIKVYGFRVCEPNHDATPHWHVLLWVPSDADAEILQAVIAEYWLSEHGQERGALEYRTNFKRMVQGGAAGYIAKYIAKNIGHVDVETHLDTADGLLMSVWAGDVQGWQRVDAWAATWGIRQFQAIGQPSVTVWREMRRVTADQVEAARVGGDALAWRVWGAVHKHGADTEVLQIDGTKRVIKAMQADWERYMRHMGGVCLRRVDWLLQPAKRVNEVVNGYGEKVTQKRVVGVVMQSGRWLVSRRQAWIAAYDSVPESESARAQRAAPWTGFTNCTARLTGKLRAALLGLKTGLLPGYERGGLQC